VQGNLPFKVKSWFNYFTSSPEWQRLKLAEIRYVVNGKPVAATNSYTNKNRLFEIDEILVRGEHPIERHLIACRN